MATPAELPEQLARRVTSFRTLALAAAGLLAAGGAAVLYSQRYAHADQFEEHVRAEQKLEGRVAAHDAVIQYIHEDVERMLDQEAANARAVGAPVLPRSHER